MANQPNNNSETNGQQPTIRHIPIFVEGRDDPIVNKNMDTPSGPSETPPMNLHTSPNSSQSDLPHSASNSIFNRVKSFPVRGGFDNEFFQNHSNNMRAHSPGGGRSVPVQVHRTTSSSSSSQTPFSRPQSAASGQHQSPNTYQQQSTSGERLNTQGSHQIPVQHHFNNTSNYEEKQPQPTAFRDDSITKIQDIQREVLELMDKVEQFSGTSKKDRQYAYLDEMLTQNLLKLDTIDAEGKENIKQARREAIKCINRCICVLEAKTDAAARNANQAPWKEQVAIVLSSA